MVAEIKLVLSDMDDTLAPHMQHDVSGAVRKAVTEVEAQGIQVAVVSGRGYPHAKNTLTVLGIEGLCVLDGGASVVDAVSGEIVWKQWIDISTTQNVVEVLKKYCTDGYFSPTHELLALQDFDTNAIIEETPCVFALRHDHESELIAQALADLTEIDGIYAFAGKSMNPVTGKIGLGIQVTHKFANKYHGVEALRNIVGIEKAHTLAIGDGDNDVPLFENAQVKVAMGNATEQLKVAADHIVGTLEDDGFAEAMHKYVL